VLLAGLLLLQLPSYCGSLMGCKTRQALQPLHIDILKHAALHSAHNLPLVVPLQLLHRWQCCLVCVQVLRAVNALLAIIMRTYCPAYIRHTWSSEVQLLHDRPGNPWLALLNLFTSEVQHFKLLIDFVLLVLLPAAPMHATDARRQQTPLPAASLFAAAMLHCVRTGATAAVTMISQYCCPSHRQTCCWLYDGTVLRAVHSALRTFAMHCHAYIRHAYLHLS
jgi:hypothetical protein